MSAPRIPSYRLHKPSGQAVVTLNGKDFYLGRWKSPESRAAYDRLISEWTANARQIPGASNGQDLTIAELCVAFLRHAETYYPRDNGTTSEYTSLKDAIRPLADLYAGTHVQEFGPKRLKAVRQKMIDSGWCRSYINRQVNRVRRVFKWGVENELVSATILHGLQAVAPLKKGRTEAAESQPVKPVPYEHVVAVLPYVSRQVAAMIQLQQLSGPRPGEIVRLCPCDVDRSGEVWIFRLDKHKTAYRGREKEIYFGPQAQAILAPFLDRPPEAYCFSPAEAEAERNALRRANRKTPMTPSQSKRRPKPRPKRAKRDRYTAGSYGRAIDYGIEKAGVPHWHPNQLRHSCGTSIRKNYGLDVAQVVLGHKVCDVTQVYAEADRARAMAAIKECG